MAGTAATLAAPMTPAITQSFSLVTLSTVAGTAFGSWDFTVGEGLIPQSPERRSLVIPSRAPRRLPSFLAPIMQSAGIMQTPGAVCMIPADCMIGARVGGG